MAPEMKDNDDYDAKIDVWSYGILLIHLLAPNEAQELVKQVQAGDNIHIFTEKIQVRPWILFSSFWKIYLRYSHSYFRKNNWWK